MNPINPNSVIGLKKIE